ncbi:alpha/beta hydrolase [Nocardioides sp. WS12]|uniref:alpha/beta hydrolase n=1 Tax=Nocardioides sp. WS12 TaxID=2486272 RepID=UPI0015FA9933|nr:alpha/beta hydrolase [Nocardioides sp. WS12]
MSEHDIAKGVRVRTYVPDGDGPHPLLVYFHGGGFILGNLDMHDLTCRFLAREAGASVVNVDYRLAPEHRFPAALDDCFAAVEWAEAHAEELCADTGRLVVMGSSAGGNLAASVAIKARDAGRPKIALQVLVNPLLDSAMRGKSLETYAHGHFLERAQVRFFWDQYIGDAPKDDPLLSPAHAESLAGLPRAIVLTSELDPLRDEGELYANRLASAGCRVQRFRVPGQLHGFLGMIDAFSDARVWLTRLADLMVTELDRPSQ